MKEILPLAYGSQIHAAGHGAHRSPVHVLDPETAYRAEAMRVQFASRDAGAINVLDGFPLRTLLLESGGEDLLRRILDIQVAIAREVFGDGPGILPICPTFGDCYSGEQVDLADVRGIAEFFAAEARRIGFDLAFETIPTLEIGQAAASVSEPRFLSYTFDGGQLFCGTSLLDAVRAHSCPVGVNCCGISDLEAAARDGLKLDVIYPNALDGCGVHFERGTDLKKISYDEMARRLHAVRKATGARVLGVCCGSEKGHLNALSNATARMQGINTRPCRVI